MRVLDVRQRGEWREVVEVITAEVPYVCDVVTASSDQQPLLWVELREHEVVSVLVLRVDSQQVDSDLRVVVQRQNL